MKGIIKKILTIILLIQIVFASLISTGQVYGMEDLLLGNTIYGHSDIVGSQFTTEDMDARKQMEDYLYEHTNAEREESPVVKTDDEKYDEKMQEIMNDYHEQYENNEEDDDESLLTKAIDGVAGLLLLPVKVLPLIIGKVLTWIMNIIVGEGFGALSVADILFNEVTLTDINFFNLESGDGTVNQIRHSVSVWYYSIRNLSAIILLVIIVYVGIRMALSTVAEDKAKYKQMLVDWLVGFALLFVLHYIMVFIININNTIVDVLKVTVENGGKVDDSIMSTLFKNSLSFGFTKGIGSAMCYVMLVGVTFLFLVTYIKRMVTIAFLIVIAPLVTVTYSIDKMGDSKSQALNTWLKEFSYNILIQPFQCVTYLALGQTAISTLQEGYSLKAVIIAIAMLIFILTSENIIKHIFHFQSKSMADTLKGAVVGTTLMSLASKGAKKVSASHSGGSNNGNGGGNNGGGSDGSSNKFADPSASMTTPTSNPTNVRQGGDPTRPARTSPSRGTGAGGSGGTGTGTGSGQQGGTSPTGTPESSTGGGSPSKGRKALNFAGRTAKRLAVGSFKAGGMMTGAMLGLGATGSADKGMIQAGMLGSSATSSVGSAAKGFVSRQMEKSQKNGQRRSLARAYNDYADSVASQNPMFTPEQVNEEVRKRAVDLMQGNVQGPLSDDDKALQAALKDLEETYKKEGMTEEQKNEQLNKDFDGIESGAISERTAPVRFVGNIKSKVSSARRANRNRRWGFNGQGRQGGGQPSPKQSPRGPRSTPSPTGGSQRESAIPPTFYDSLHGRYAYFTTTMGRTSNRRTETNTRYRRLKPINNIKNIQEMDNNCISKRGDKCGK